MAASRKFRNVAADPRVSLVVDDLASRDPWRPRALEVRGVAEALHGPDVIRIHPRRILVFGLEDDGPGARTVGN